ICEGNGESVERTPFAAVQIVAGVDRIAEDVDDTAEHPFADGHAEGVARGEYGGAPRQAGGGGQRDAPDGLRIEMADHFDDDPVTVAGAQFVMEFGKAVGEMRIHHAAAHRQHRAAPKFVMMVQCASLLNTGVPCRFGALPHTTLRWSSPAASLCKPSIDRSR